MTAWFLCLLVAIFACWIVAELVAWVDRRRPKRLERIDPTATRHREITHRALKSRAGMRS